MKIFCTGISGIDKKKFWDNVKEFATGKGKELDIYNVGDLIFKNSKELNEGLNQKNILNTDSGTLTGMRGNAFKDIIKDYDKHNNSIINTHATFLWGYVYQNAFDAKYVSEMDIDMFITLIDNEESLEKKLAKTNQWHDEFKLSTTDILYWQNIEVNTTQTLSEFKKKKHFIFAKNQPVEDMYKLIYHPKTEVVYTSYPMTKMDKEGRKKIDRFVEELREYFIVLDPKAIELSETYSKVAGAQTVERDLNWYVSKVSKIFVYFPEVVYSAGVDAEIIEASKRNKDVYTIYPDCKISPFIERFSNYNLFKTKKELFERIEKEGYKPIRL